MNCKRGGCDKKAFLKKGKHHCQGRNLLSQVAKLQKNALFLDDGIKLEGHKVADTGY